MTRCVDDSNQQPMAIPQTEQEWRTRLTPERYAVLRNKVGRGPGVSCSGREHTQDRVHDRGIAAARLASQAEDLALSMSNDTPRTVATGPAWVAEVVSRSRTHGMLIAGAASG